MLGASEALGDFLVRDHASLDLLVDADRLAQPPSPLEARASLLRAVGAIPESQEPVAGTPAHGGSVADALRVAYRRWLLGIAVRDLSGLAGMEYVAAWLSDLADATLEAALAIARHEVGKSAFTCRLAVIGMGRIGSEFVKRAQGFNMKVIAFDPFLTQARADELKIELADSPDTALAGADVVTLHVPLTDDTRHIINADRLALMNKGGLVVNCARGGLIDESALKAAIDSGHIAGCALDVYENEPPSPDHPLFSCQKHIAFTPHLGASTAEAQENVGIQVAEQIRDFLTTGEIRNAINMPSLDAEALAELGPYLHLATALGKVLAKLGPSSPDSLRVSYHGPLAEKDTGLVSRHVLTALLSAACNDGQVNVVNAPAVAKSMGIDLTESTISAATEFSELLVAELTKGEDKFRLAGTIIGKTPRIVEIDHTFVDLSLIHI